MLAMILTVGSTAGRPHHHGKHGDQGLWEKGESRLLSLPQANLGTRPLYIR